MEFRVLGPVEARDGDRRLTFDGAKPRTVVAALLLARETELTDARLGTLLWGSAPPATATSQIHTYMSRLRKRLGPGCRIVRQHSGYLLRTGPAWVDRLEFERLSGLGQRHLAAARYELAAAQLTSALALWRGRALADVTDFLANAEGPRLEEARLAALESRIDADLALGRHTLLVPELTGLVAEHRLRERFRAQLMTALYRCHRQADALAVYDRGRRILAEELGVSPSEALDRVYYAILRRDQPGTGWTIRSRQTVRPAMLPADIATFTGRAADLTLLAAGARRRFMVIGMPGVGKTALAVRASHACAGEFPDGQLYADLGGAGRRPPDPAEVLTWFLRALGTPDHAIPATVDERIQLYRSRLARRRMLVLLDGVAADAQLLPLLPGESACLVIVTGRTWLGTAAELDVIDLDVLDPSESLALLGKLAGPRRLAAEPAAAERLAELCGHLPLALRAAGARLAAKGHWSISHLVRRITAAPSIVDELGPRVRETIEHGCRNLAGGLLPGLRRLATLPSPEFPLWAAARALAIAPRAAEDILEHLIDTRLVRPAPPDANGQPRYRIHALVRQTILNMPTHDKNTRSA
ncbi:MAG TPA: BTAD domain-containing putative transcriptional regulator [Actinophytocola sp.]|uniref:AfsR/SARP family transcriptional regulator n=1 Tax=Actinophytocola sp. TaxID=1872138 RepID=UPI002DDD6234|nr:BTAD domain-containing putative transcriptional regulator [Actinophytocola sp.]HEV2782250.1 BTAD domain-containing putative transcriptional regulator [Actinophytocola sp.]